MLQYWITLIYSLLLCRDDNVQEFYTRWDEVLLSMSKIPSDDILGKPCADFILVSTFTQHLHSAVIKKKKSDDILESLYKLRIRESAQSTTVLELYDMEIHQKKSMPNYQKLKTMVKRCIDQKLRLRNFDARQWKIESGAVVKNRKGIKRR